MVRGKRDTYYPSVPRYNPGHSNFAINDFSEVNKMEKRQNLTRSKLLQNCFRKRNERNTKFWPSLVELVYVYMENYCPQVLNKELEKFSTEIGRCNFVMPIIDK